ncbi:MAG TPA: trypsin-like peptidase domain-containing protein, partial [Candidatus Limnocylindrales bacterium]|nr:trypsin-like peptidase domain-containing protein [Candidatus Limnocylindrales bacterium]
DACGAILKGTGRVFFVMAPFLYSCSGTVVQDGRAGYSLVLTAGHCVSDKGKFATQWIFIPEYDSNPIEYGDCGNSKYGCWTAQALFVHENFASQKRFNDTAVIHDFAFALMGPGGKSGTASLETTVGSFPIAFSGPTTGTTLSAFGYPASSPYDGLQLTYCRGPIGQDPGTGNATWSMACDMTGGSSGGPWVSGDPLTNSATLRSLNSYGYSGVDNMYGPKFGSRAQAVYDAANGTATSDTRVTGG